LCVVYFYDHLNDLTWSKTIFSEWHSWSCYAFADTTATSNLSIWFFYLTLNRSGLSKNDFSSSLDFEFWWNRLDCSCHMIRYHSFFCWSVVIETSRPSLKCLETEGKWVLPWREATTLIYHDFASCKLISCLIIGHLKIAIGRCSDVFGSSVVKVLIIFRFTIRDSEILHYKTITSVCTSSWGGIAAIGSKAGGGGRWPGLWCLGAGRWSSFASAHFTH